MISFRCIVWLALVLTARSMATASVVVSAPANDVLAAQAQAKATPKQAIHDGLVWLARHQNPDGSWSPKTLKDRCPPGKTCGASVGRSSSTQPSARYSRQRAAGEPAVVCLSEERCTMRLLFST